MALNQAQKFALALAQTGSIILAGILYIQSLSGWDPDLSTASVDDDLDELAAKTEKSA
jgi:hypothetical protein